MKDSLKTLFRHLPGNIRGPIERAEPFYRDRVQEIILRTDLPIAIECGSIRYYLTDKGSLTSDHRSDDLLCTSVSELQSCFRSICDYSVYARQNELNHGYLTAENGVRIGVCGKAVSDENGIRNIKDITTLSFRIASEAFGCADKLLALIHCLDGILLCGPPCSGKTTLIRELARRLSYTYKVSVIDERNEISASVNGKRAFDIGLSDALIGVSKAEGVIFSLRSLSPDIIICDELGGDDDAASLRESLRCGTTVIATAHARSLRDLRNRKATAELLDTGAFRYVILLGGRETAGQIKTICDLGD